MRRIVIGTVFLTTLVVLINCPLWAQSTGKITGTVADSTNGETLPSANLYVEGTSAGATTDLEGGYWISNVPIGKQVVVASYIGYESKRVEVLIHPGSALDLDFKLTMKALE